MKNLIFLSLLLFSSNSTFGQTAKSLQSKPDAQKKILLVEASCGECNFELPGKDCDLAVRIDGAAYFVDGVTIHDFGHPHDKNGFCVAVRKAEVQGEVSDGRFKASYFKLLPVEGDSPRKN